METIKAPIFHVDAFADRPFTGNPAAVCLLSEPPDDAWLQSVAAEMNLSETAFLLPHHEDGWTLRWFTPTVEVDLCGHATLASAHVLWALGLVPAGDQARFHTRSGLLTADRAQGATDDGGEEGETWIWLDFPATPAEPWPVPVGLDEALGVTPLVTARTRFDLLVEVADEAQVRGLRPDVTRLARATPSERGVLVTAPASRDGYDFVSRFFAPQSGVDEDPVTGSAHCALAPYWTERLGRDRGDELVGYQASARGGIVRVRMAGGGERVRLGGQAITVLQGELEV